MTRTRMWGAAIAVLAAAVFPGRLSPAPIAGSLSITLKAGPVAIVQSKAGTSALLDGFNPTNAPGLPAVPFREYRILLPPGTEFDRLEEVSAPARSVTYAAPWVCAPAILKGEKEFAHRFDPARTQPASAVAVVGGGAAGLYRYVAVRFTPVRVTAAKNLAAITDSVSLRVFYRPAAQGAGWGSPSRWPTKEEAAKQFYNAGSILPLYRVDLSELFEVFQLLWRDYVIVTTDEIYGESQQIIEEFKADKESQGYAVLIATETLWGGYPGATASDRVREWLQAWYRLRGMEYGLIIAADEDIPFKRMDLVPGSEPILTDWYYADLDGEWDLNGDGLCGDYRSDCGPGGVDVEAELKVGRILYDRDTLGHVLRRIMQYEQNQYSPDNAWRSAVLQLGAIIHLADDGAVTACGSEPQEYIYAHAISPHASLSSVRMYEAGNDWTDPALHYADSDCDLTAENVYDRLVNPAAGVILWCAHGSTASASRRLLAPGPGGIETTHIPFAEAEDAFYARQELVAADPDWGDHERPPVIVSASCLNSDPDPQGLGWAFMDYYAAGFIGGTMEVNLANDGWTSPADGGAQSFLALAAQSLIDEKKALGDAFTAANQNYFSYVGAYDNAQCQNCFIFNLYGDPSLRVYNRWSLWDVARLLGRARIVDLPAAVEGLKSRQPALYEPLAKKCKSIARRPIPVLVVDADQDGREEWVVFPDAGSSGLALAFESPEEGLLFAGAARADRALLAKIAKALPAK